MKKKLFTILVSSCFVFLSSAQIIHVPEGQSTIQAGINAASTGDTVLVAEGTYYENIRFMGKAITVASEFIMDNDTSHILNTIMDGSQATDPDTSATVMFLNYEDTTSILNGFTITGGSGVHSTLYNIRRGGGIFCSNAGAKIMNNRIIENHLIHENKAGGAGIGCQRDDGDHWIIIRNNNISYNSSTTNGVSAYGGGIYASINTIIENNVIIYNQCENTGSGFADGGAIEIEQYPDYDINTLIANNLIQHNSIVGYKCFGGGIAVNRAKAMVLDNSIKYNTVIAENNGDGGGIWIDSPLENTKMVNNDITNNSITAGNYGRGGGVVFWNPRAEIIMIGNKVNNNITDAVECRGTGVLFRCNQFPVGEIQVLRNEFIGNLGNINAANCHGGGVCLNDVGDTLVVFDSNRFEGNTAIKGGGILSRRSYNLKLTNNLFINNTASGSGGGLRLYQNATNKKTSLHPQIINNTFYNNFSDYGGGINLYCETNVPVIFNNIFWENQAPNYNDIYYDVSGTDTIIVSYNNIDEGEIYGIWNGIGNINEDPLFVDPVSGDFHVHNCLSPCINTGIDALEIDGTWYYCPTNDIDNDARPYANTFPDIGADETPCLETSIKNYQIGSSSANNLSIFPNPVMDKATIEFNNNESGFIILSLIDLTGKEIQRLVSKQLPTGMHQFEWNAGGLLAGIYFCVLKTNEGVQTRKMIKVE
ncbi:MAG: T9SS type A sorting domain-containing protein [Bacteroidales bacterium]|nr:T9SS type A sorting domain-containing protein [Bacteroidales bacterium]